MTAPDGYVVTLIVVLFCLLGLFFAGLYALHTAQILIGPPEGGGLALQGGATSDSSVADVNGGNVYEKIKEISAAIAEGANAFLYREYKIIALFMAVFGTLVFVLIGGATGEWADGALTMVAFFTGASTSVISGFIGMRIAVIANSRTACSAQRGWSDAFNAAFKAGCVMGFSLVSIGVLVLYILVNFFRLKYSIALTADPDGTQVKALYEAIAGYGMGGSCVALFGRVGGGIYTKAADVGADLVGKVEAGIPEDDPRNPATIADNVGDNVGDIAGMGADLFGSFAESTCAVMVIASQAGDVSMRTEFSYLCFPIVIIACGIIVCLLGSFVATHFILVQSQDEIEPSLKRQLMVSTVGMTIVMYPICYYFLPDTITAISTTINVRYWHIYICLLCGLWSGLAIGYTTEYYTSNRYTPVREVSEACSTGAATNIIYGLALGYKSAIIPVICMSITIFVSYSLAAMFGIACAAIGILSNMSIGLTIDAYGPICDNAGGIAEMSGMGKEIRDITDALDAAGNTTAAIGKGFAIGSAALVSLALFGGFVTVVNLSDAQVSILDAWVFAGLLYGAMLPYWFSALTMKAVGLAAKDMVEEVRLQFKEPGILEGTKKPDYARCVDIATQGSLKMMIGPACLVILHPLGVGYFLGVKCLAGVLVGALVSGVQVAVSASNTGGAWDNAKKYIEATVGKGTDKHKAAVIGDTVGDPLKDTSGPSLNILIKLMAIISLVFARSFPSVDKGGLLEQMVHA